MSNAIYSGQDVFVSLEDGTFAKITHQELLELVRARSGGSSRKYNLSDAGYGSKHITLLALSVSNGKWINGTAIDRDVAFAKLLDALENLNVDALSPRVISRLNELENVLDSSEFEQLMSVLSNRMASGQ